MVFLVNMARIVFAPLVEPLRESFAVSPATIGLITTLVWLGSALPRIPTGYLLTRVPRHRVVLGTGAVLTVSSGFTALAGSPVVLGVGAFLMGLSSGAYFIAANPLVSELYPQRVGRAIGIHGMASQTAAVIAPLLVSGFLLVADWRAVFLAIGLAAMVATVALYRISADAAVPSAGAADRDLVTALRRQWPIILTGVAFMATAGFVWNGLFNFYVSYLVADKALAEPTARTLLTVVFGAGVPAFFLTGRLADRVPHVPLLLAILGGFTLCVFALTAVSGLLAIAAVTAVLGFVVHSLFPAMDTFMLDSLPDENRASAYAVFSGTMMLIQATGSWAVGTLTGLGLSYDRIFFLFAAGLVVALAALLALHAARRLPTGASTGVPE